jgi:transposase
MAHALTLKAITQAKIKTDKRDSKILANLHRGNLIPEAYIFPKKERAHRDLTRRRQSLVKKRATHFKELKMMLTRHGFDSPSRNDIAILDITDLEDYLNHDKHLDFMIHQTVSIMSTYTECIKEIESELEDLLETDDLTVRLREIPGIGKALSKVLRLEIGDISRFKNVKCFSSWCRVVPSLSQSGSSSRRGGGSKQGNAFMKNALMQAASAAIRLNPQIRAYREFHVERRRGSAGKLVTTNIIAHKIAVAVFHIFKGKSFEMDRLFNIEGLTPSN